MDEKLKDIARGSAYKGIEPIMNRVLIKRNEPIRKIGSILLPVSSEMDQLEGTIVALGCEAEWMGLHVDDRVRWGKFAGTKPYGADDDLYMINAEDILSRIHMEE